jgi:hypothetical protein
MIGNEILNFLTELNFCQKNSAMALYLKTTVYKYL